MSTEAEHLALANRNQAALDHLLSDTARCSEWVAVVAFYKSLHVAEAVFARETPPTHCHDHHIRLNKLKATKTYALLFPHYRAMWSTSMVARYLAQQAAGPLSPKGVFACFDDFLPANAIRPKLLDNYLYTFEHLAVQLLGPSGKTLVRYSKTAGK
jgi:hypothetical protein